MLIVSAIVLAALAFAAYRNKPLREHIRQALTGPAPQEQLQTAPPAAGKAPAKKPGVGGAGAD